MLIGVVDHVQFDPAQGTIVLQGRDLSSALIDTKTQETFANKTSSQIATILAGRHGLTPVVTATSTLVGQYYQLEHDRTSLGNFSRQTTEWDLLTYLAQTEGYDLFVSGKELHFQPTAPSTAPPFPIIYQAGPPIVMNVLTLSLERSLTIAKDIQVTVKTWNSKQKNAFTRIVKATGAKSSQTTQNYVFVKPNMTPDEALKFGQQQLIELTKHERLINLTMPGELTLTPRNMLGLTGTGTSWDQAYYVAEIEREISFENGFTQRVRGKNTSPRTQTTVE
jgi:phage protein D